MEEIKRMLEEQAKTFEAFKSANDQRMKAVESRGHADPLLTEQVEKLNAALSEHQKQIDSIEKSAQRRGAGAASEADERNAKHAKAFNAFVRTGRDADLAEFQAAMQTGNDPGGGWLVPETTSTRIIEFEQNNSPMRELCTVETVANENILFPVDMDGTTATWVGETEARGETNTPLLGEVKPYFGELQAEPKLTQRMIDDAAFNIEAWLEGKIGRAFALQENAAYTSGNGAKKPKGILGHAMSANGDSARPLGEIQFIASGSSGKFVADKIIDLIYALKRGYRQNAQFMTSTLAVAEVRKLKDGAGNYLWQPSFQIGQPATLSGYAVVENDDMPDPAADALALVFAEFKRAYTIFDVRGVRMLRDALTAKPYVKLYTTKRVGGLLTDSNAVKVLKLSA